jgi:hypothetical protein
MHQYSHEGDAYRRIELITGEQRRRRWTAEEKAALVAGSCSPGQRLGVGAAARGVTDVARSRRSGLRCCLADALWHPEVADCRDDEGNVLVGGSQELLGPRPLAWRPKHG